MIITEPVTDIRQTSGLAIPVFCITALAVFAGVFFGVQFVDRAFEHPDAVFAGSESSFGSFAPWDGVWYQRIVSDGYSYDRSQMSNVAFYPLYPKSAAVTCAVSGLGVDDSLFIVSQSMLLAAFVVFERYLRHRSPLSEAEPDYSILALGLFPTTYWLRMSYSESTFLFTALLAMFGLERRWPMWVVALCVGLATSARAVGVALLLPFLWTLWQERRSVRSFVLKSAMYLPLCVWGIGAFIVFQWIAFDEPLAFVKTQRHWHERAIPDGWQARVVAHATLEPLLQVYDPSSDCYWCKDPPSSFPLFSMTFMSPIFVLFTWATIAWGGFRKILTTKEVLLSVGLLGIPYFTHAWHACGSSEARYASVVYPFYIVLGHELAKLPAVVSTILVAMSAVLLAMYSALFVQWYWFY